MSIRLVLRGEPLLSLPVDNGMTIDDDDIPQPADNGPAWKKWEDEIILTYVKAHGPRWVDIASLLSGRTDNSCRNRHHRIIQNLEKHGEIVDGRKSGYRSNSIKKIKKKPKANKAKPKPGRDTIDSESDVDNVLLIDSCETVLPSEDELFAGILPTGEYEIFDLDDLVTTPSPEQNYQAWHSTMTSGSSDRSDDELLDVILTSASVLTGGSVE